jgi:hypothetical protein
MIDLVNLKIVVDYARDAFSAVMKADAQTREAWRAALPKLQEAVLQTQLYWASQADGRLADRQAETRLVAMWSDAATAFYTLNGELAARLQLKAEYWTEPKAWSRQQIVDAGISLQHLAELTRQLLYEGK